LLLTLAAVGAEGATISLAWDPPTSGPSVAGYIVRYGSQIGQYPNSFKCGASTQCTVSVANNQTYYLVVVAVGTSGVESGPSAPVAARVDTSSLVLGINGVTASFPAQGGTGQVSVVGPGAWAAQSTNSTWLRVSPGTGGAGSGAFGYAVTPNALPSGRGAALSVSGISIAVTQVGGPPTKWNLPTDIIARDYDGDGKADIGVYRDSSGVWLTRNSSVATLQQIAWGAPTLDDIPVPADYDGDHRADVAVYRRSTGEWFIRRSTDGGLTYIPWGAPSLGDIPVTADYDGDGKADIAVYRTSTGQWLIRYSSTGSETVFWGAPVYGDLPVPADYDGDGKADIAVYRSATGEWFVRLSGGGSIYEAWGAPSLNDVPVPGKYDADGRSDIAVYRPGSGEWFIRRSTDGGLTHIPWGAAQIDIPVPADYDGDGRTDVAVYRSTDGQWLISLSGGGSQILSWGAPSLIDIVRGR